MQTTWGDVMKFVARQNLHLYQFVAAKTLGIEVLSTPAGTSGEIEATKAPTKVSRCGGTCRCAAIANIYNKYWDCPRAGRLLAVRRHQRRQPRVAREVTNGGHTRHPRTLAAEIGVALAPLELLSTPENLPRLFLELGLHAEPDLAGNAEIGQALSPVSQKLQAMDDAVTALLDAADQVISTQTLAASAQAIQAIAAFAASLDSVATSIRNAAPELASFAETFVERLLGDSVIRYLELTHPFVLRVLALAGIAELIPLEVTLDGAPVSILRRQLHLDRVSQVVLDPMSAAQTTYGWGTETFDSLTFFLRVRDVFQAVDLLAEVEP